MEGFALSEEQLSELKVAYRKAKRSNAHAAYKINVVILLGIGWSLYQIKQALLLDEETLRSYVKKYRKNGIEDLLRTHFSKSRRSLPGSMRTSWRKSPQILRFFSLMPRIQNTMHRLPMDG